MLAPARPRSRVRRGLLLTVAALAVTALPVPDVAAAPTWLPGGYVAPAAASGEVGAVDLDAAGNAVAVWSQDGGGGPQVVAASRPLGGSWGAPVPLSAAGAAAGHPQVLLEGDGRATAVWLRATGPDTYGLQASTRSAGGAWSAPVDLPGATTAIAEAALVVRPGASVLVAWPRLVAGQWAMSAAVRSATGSWGPPVDIAAGYPVQPGRPRLGVDGAGVTTAVWSAHDGAHQRVMTASTPLSGPWSPPVPLSAADQDAVDPDVAVAGNGTTVAVWSRWNGADRWVAQSSTRPAKQTGWIGPVDLSGPGLSAGEVDVATNEYGSRYLATWTAAPASGPSVVQAALLDEAEWRPSVTLSDAAAASNHPAAVVGNTTPATVTWLASAGPAHVVQGATLPTSATAFGPAAALSPADRDAGPPRLAQGRRGDVLVLWGETSPSTFQPRSAAYDVAGPTLPTLRMAGHAVAGHPARFLATAVDAWSPVATYAWTFGDGTTATGPSPTHVFAEPGRYRVRLRVTDAVGNTTARTRRTKVVEAPEITGFSLAERRISRAGKARIRLELSVAAKVKLVLRSKHRHRVHGALHRQKLVLKRDLGAGRSTVVVKGSRLLPDTWVVTATARTLGVDSRTVKKLLVVGP